MEVKRHPLVPPFGLKTLIPNEIYKSHIVAFPDEYAVATSLRPDVPLAESIRVQRLQRLTPLSYDRNIFHLEFDLRGTEHIKNYKMGDALAVYPKNSNRSVDDFIRIVLLPEEDRYNESALKSIRQQIVILPPSLVSREESAKKVEAAGVEEVKAGGLFPTSLRSDATEEVPVCITTIERILTTVLDINGSPSKDFLKQLSSYAVDILEKVRLAEFSLERMQSEFAELVVNSAATYASIFGAFPTARPPIEVLLEIIPPMKPRLYSIASSALFQPHQLDLLVVEETWKPTPTTKQLYPILENTMRNENTKNDCGELRFGLCSHYLSTLKPGDTIMVSLTASTMLLPQCQLAPVVMAGLGTGMAPFRAFLQEKLYWKRRGEKVGPLALYFGSRHKSMEFLYGDELEAMQSEGLLTRLSCAFSRDQLQKIYIQDRIREDAEWLAELLVAHGGYFYLCGPTWPAEDVKEALISSFVNHGGVSSREEAEDLLKEMKENGRYVLEVY